MYVIANIHKIKQNKTVKTKIYGRAKLRYSKYKFDKEKNKIRTL